ncbi:hypothetical protein BU17DRAFT_86286 [Hysterangium stoloniferum]|nr:hypothetical protein BU17DRAFT_86286 [Hysterangium stoloniferum]
MLFDWMLAGDEPGNLLCTLCNSASAQKSGHPPCAFCSLSISLPRMLQIKLVQTGTDPHKVTRKLTFPQLPLWSVLATRIENLYGIPSKDVGLSYIDSDGDEVTLSSQEELQDYHMTLSPTSFEFMKFTVKDLAVSGARRPPSEIESSSHVSLPPPVPVDLHPSINWNPRTFDPTPTHIRVTGPGLPARQADNKFPLRRPFFQPLVNYVPSPGFSPFSSRSASPTSFIGMAHDPNPQPVRGRSMSSHRSPYTSPSRTPPRAPRPRRSRRSRSHSPLFQHPCTVARPLSPISQPPGLFGPRTPEPPSPGGYELSIRATPPLPASRPLLSQRHSVVSFMTDIPDGKYENPDTAQEGGHNGSAPIIVNPSRSASVPRNGSPPPRVLRVVLPRSRSTSPSGVPETVYMPQRNIRPSPPFLYRGGVAHFRNLQPAEPGTTMDAAGTSTADKTTIGNLDITNLTNVILGEVRETMAVEMWQGLQTKLEEEKEKLANSVRIEMASARDELSNLNDDLEAANEELRTLGGIATTLEEIAKARQEVQQAWEEIQQAREEIRQAREEIQQTREEIACTRDASGRIPESIRNEWEEIKASCEEIKEAWRTLERSREEAGRRVAHPPHPPHPHHPPFPHIPWMTPFPGPPPTVPSGGPHHGPSPFPHRPPFHMHPPPPPPLPPHPPHPRHHPGYPHFPGPPRPHHPFGMEPPHPGPDLTDGPLETDSVPQEHGDQELRRRSSFPARLGPPREPRVLRAKFSDGGLRFGISPDGGSLRFNRSGDDAARREELEEAKRVYKEKKAAWRREREEARNANRDIRASMRVRPFDTIIFPPAPPPAHSPLKTHLEEFSSDEETRPLPPQPDATPLHFTTQQSSLRRSLLQSLVSMGFTHESHPLLERAVQREIERTDAEQVNSETMMQNVLDELLRN